MVDRELDALVQQIRSLPPRAGGCVIIAIDGPSGGGKSTLASQLADLIPATLVAMEDIYHGWDSLEESSHRIVDDVLTPLSRNHPGGFHLWDWEKGIIAEHVAVTPAPFIIVEGVGSGTTAATDFTSFLIWVEAPEDQRFERAMRRSADTYKGHWDQWAKQEHEHFTREQTRSRANVIFSTSAIST